MIQNLQPLRQGGVAVTIAKYETPLHHDINKIGMLLFHIDLDHVKPFCFSPSVSFFENVTKS